MQNGTEKTNSSYDVIGKMEAALALVKDKLGKFKDAEILQARCAPLLDMFNDHIQSIRLISPQVEQMKGLTRGIQMASPVVMQFSDILRKELQDPADMEQLHAGVTLVSRINRTLVDTHSKQREEMLKQLGKLEGTVNAAMQLLTKVERFVSHHEAQLVQQAEQDADDAERYGDDTPPANVPVQDQQAAEVAPAKAAKKPSPKLAK